jgi:hypothetical protein
LLAKKGDEDFYDPAAQYAVDAYNYDPAAQYAVDASNYDPAAQYAVGSVSYAAEAVPSQMGSSNQTKGGSDLPADVMREMQRFGGSMEETIEISNTAIHNPSAWRPEHDTTRKRSSKVHKDNECMGIYIGSINVVILSCKYQKPTFETKIWNHETGEVSITGNSKMAKSKHQIGWLAAQATAQAEELADKRGKGFLTKAQVSIFTVPISSIIIIGKHLFLFYLFTRHKRSMVGSIFLIFRLYFFVPPVSVYTF